MAFTHMYIHVLIYGLFKFCKDSWHVPWAIHRSPSHTHHSPVPQLPGSVAPGKYLQLTKCFNTFDYNPLLLLFLKIKIKTDGKEKHIYKYTFVKKKKKRYINRCTRKGGKNTITIQKIRRPNFIKKRSQKMITLQYIQLLTDNLSGTCYLWMLSYKSHRLHQSISSCPITHQSQYS